SSATIPEDVVGFLQLGDNFSLPIKNKKSVILEFIKNFEYSLNKLPLNKRSEFRNKSMSLLNAISSYSYQNNAINNCLLELHQKTKNFLTENPNIIVTRADKGNTTVALNRDDYIKNVEKLLEDKDTYLIVLKNPINKLISSLRELLIKWKNKGFISLNLVMAKFDFTDGSLPRAYGLPKIHKVNCPYRIIVSSIDSPLYKLSLYLHKLMFNNFPTNNEIYNSKYVMI
ncbi:hypothetical protein EAG_07003, partial [Camponotus floridanus]